VGKNTSLKTERREKLLRRERREKLLRTLETREAVSDMEKLSNIMTGIARDESSACGVSPRDAKDLVRNVLAFASDSRAHASILASAYRNGRFPKEPLLSIAVEATSMWFEGLRTGFHGVSASASGCSNGDGMIPMLSEIFRSGRLSSPEGRDAFLGAMRSKRFDEKRCCGALLKVFDMLSNLSGFSFDLLTASMSAALCILGEGAGDEDEHRVERAELERKLGESLARHGSTSVLFDVLDTNAKRFPFLGPNTAERLGTWACEAGIAGRLADAGIWNADDIVKHWPTDKTRSDVALAEQFFNARLRKIQSLADVFVRALENTPEKVGEYAEFLAASGILDKCDVCPELLPLRDALARAGAGLSENDTDNDGNGFPVL